MNTSEINIGIDISKASSARNQEPASVGVTVERPEKTEKKVDETDLIRMRNKEEITEVVDSLHEFVNMVQTKLNFSVQEETNNIVVRVIDRETDEIIRQIPAEEIMKVQARMQELSGILFDKNV